MYNQNEEENVLEKYGRNINEDVKKKLIEKERDYQRENYCEVFLEEDMNDYKHVCDVWGDNEPIYSLEDLEDCYNNSCPLRFISNWKLDVNYVKQFEDNVIFEWK